MEFITFYGTWNFFTVFTRSRHWTIPILMQKILVHVLTPYLLNHLLTVLYYITKHCLRTEVLGVLPTIVKFFICTIVVQQDFLRFLGLSRHICTWKRDEWIIYIYLKFDKGITARVSQQTLPVNQFYKLDLQFVFFSSYENNVNAFKSWKFIAS
jgi:hypothetical protein